MVRKSWDHYFMDMAYMAATRATCPRRHVGAILVKDKKIMGSAYNGSPAGAPDCYEAGCMIEESLDEINGELVKKKRCIRTIHAEQNLLLFTDLEDRRDAIVYVTDLPCWTCTKQLANSGIVEVVYHRPYLKDEKQVKELLEGKGILIRHLHEYEAPQGLTFSVIE